MKKTIGSVSLALMLIFIFAGGCSPAPTPIPTTPTPSSTAPPTITPSPTPTTTPTPTLIPTPTEPSIRSDEVSIQVTGAEWTETYNNEKAMVGYKILVVTFRLEFLGGTPEAKRKFSVKNDRGVNFNPEIVEVGFNVGGGILGWVFDILESAPEPVQIAKGEIVDPLTIVFTGPASSEKFIFSYNDLPPVDITELIGREQSPTPQSLFLRPRCGDSYTARANEPLEIRYGAWGAIGEELAGQNAEHLTVNLVIDGKPVTGEQQPVVPFSSEIPCGTPPADTYGTYYIAHIDSLSAGTHAVTVTFILDEQVTDGHDENGDGQPDLYGPGEVFVQQFTVVVK